MINTSAIKIVCFVLLCWAETQAGRVRRETTCPYLEHCTTCAAPDKECKTCGPGYGLAGNRKTCVRCPSNCLTCEDVNNDDVPECLTCRPKGLGLRTDRKDCVACATAFCATCFVQTNDNGVILGTPPERCELCLANYVLDQTNNKCLNKPAYCITAEVQSGKAVCTKCSSSHRVINGACSGCPSHCTTCETGTDRAICTKCNDRYKVVNQACTRCSSANCLKCSDVNNKEQCDACDNGHKWDATAGNCLLCSSNCASFDQCVTKNGRAGCSACKSLYGLKTTDDICYLCSYVAGEGCTACGYPSNAWQCSTCSAGYVIGTDKRCHKCPAGCSTCSFTNGATRCTVCSNTFGLATIEKMCLPCQDSRAATCDYVSSGTISKTCLPKHVLGPDKLCKACPTRCDECQYSGSNIVCTKTSAGYGINAAGAYIACLTLDPRCSSCQVTNSVFKCQGCEVGYAITTTSTCKACTTFDPKCSTCNSVVCQTCVPGYGMDPTANNVCKACTTIQENCTECGPNAQSQFMCKKCKLGYGMFITPCLECAQHFGPQCNQCNTIGGSSKCTGCVSGYFFHSDTKCYAAVGNCKVHNVDLSTTPPKVTCTTCDDGYGRTSNGGCTKCPDHCQTCAYNGATLECQACKPYFTVSAAKTQCVGCQQGCPTCTSNGLACLSCGTSKTLLNEAKDICIPCPALCNKCMADSRGIMVCNTDGCFPNYVKDIRVGQLGCLGCDLKCADGSCSATSAGQTTCSKCILNYGPTLDKSKCQPCWANCVPGSCSARADGRAVCSKCIFPFIASKEGLVCKSCPRYCTSGECSISGNDVPLCAKCQPDYTASKDKTSCLKCPAYCNAGECGTSGEDKAFCNVCSPGYTLSKDKLTCLVCPNGCVTGQCSTNTDNKAECAKCNTGYSLQKDKLQCNACGFKIPNCKRCTDEDTTGALTCIDCQPNQGKSSDNKTCFSCHNTISNCATCEQPWKCTQCSGFAVKSADLRTCTHQCFSCPKGSECHKEQKNPSTSNIIECDFKYQRCSRTDYPVTEMSIRTCTNITESNPCSSTYECRGKEDTNDRECSVCCDGHLCNHQHGGQTRLTASTLLIATTTMMMTMPLILSIQME